MPVHPLFNRRVSQDPLQRRLSACKACRYALLLRILPFHVALNSSFCLKQESRPFATKARGTT
jgi:hypothetical protein